MTRSAQEPSAPHPAVEASETEDSLFERWLARTSTSHPRLRAARAPPPQPQQPVPPLGDDLADGWFK
ncbi:MAG TPA: hypothetical protein VGG39_20240 [Polyangiaceae bacterium]|jgi:hypothetical protein